jgi:hypothetical protein
LNGTAKTPPPANPGPISAPPTPLQAWLRENSVLYTLLNALGRERDPGVDMFVDPYRVIVGKLDLSFGQSYIRESFDMTQARNLEGESLSHEAILKTRDLVEKNGGKFVIIVMPTKEETYRAITEVKMGKDAVDSIAAPRLRMLDFCREQKLMCFDLLPVLQAQADQNAQVFYPTDPHLNVEGNAVIAEAIAQFLSQ